MFMSAIEKITAKTGQIHIASSDEDGQEVTEVPVWNGTVANLTLMAWVPLPQRSYLLLLVATLSQRGWDPALVGLAAFNLLACIWLVLVVVSRDLMEIWEAMLGFLFFPL